jgi:RNA polymerase sigma-70 factor (ECF subfamily)
MALAIRLLRSRDDAEEAVQEALVRGWRHAGSCRDPRKPTAWLLTITRRECMRLASYRRDKTEAALQSCSEAGPSSDPSPSVDLAVDVETVLQQLPEEDRLLLELRYGEQLTQGEIAERMGWPEGTVKTKLHRIRVRVRSRMEVKSRWTM